MDPRYQDKLIRNYYLNRDTIMLNKLSELVSELYLAESSAKKNVLWQRAHKAMTKLKVPPPIVNHIMQKRNVEILAKNLEDWLKGAKKK